MESFSNMGKNSWKFGVLAGLFAGVIDVLMIYFLETGASPWLLIQAGLAWTINGFVVVKNIH